ncbi:CsbD family protein [Xylophilus sp.]|uniref:CsbD family protein n=1 Tax=Xylophilus sp. TaxID=2653893 RepID=UPI0013B9113F|nr:CsbD family protein [Xylophilus sp.]KAF1047795.1 MAG: hypothetical protein GAK38_01738 [Xylophilus sp.]
MNSEQIKGAAKVAAGKIQQKAGELLDSEAQKAKGVARQVEGNAELNEGDVKHDQRRTPWSPGDQPP